MAAELVTADNRQLLTRWVNDHGRAVRGYLRGLTGQADAADDLAQEVFRRAWLASERYVDHGQERAYLLTIADRLAVDAARKRGREVVVDEATWREVEPATEELEPVESLSGRETSEQLAGALEMLSDSQRRVLLLRFYGEMPFERIAAALDCPLGTVLSHCRRGLLALRKLLAEELQ